eukprot:TRINITY_DN71162_c0_g1_i1.p1 TRINITY_DN71162_c0_g1~~TRINITY_DN71162_c0_g1_i1.p1  ORF type:complete len:220 (-),score=56.05 TRINITY_DN71162_c0_g1_i1:187-846(-)
MGGLTTAALAFLGLVSAIVLMWMIVPTEQTIGADFPNVLILRGFGGEALPSISHDNSTLPEIDASTAAWFNGFYQYDPLFYHKSMDRFVQWEERGQAYIFSCTLFCSPANTSAKDARLVLLHIAREEKKNLWYLMELRDDDANSPVLYARSKFRKAVTYNSPWVTVTPGGAVKSRDLPDVYICTAWDLFRFDTPLKWGVTAALLVGTVLLYRQYREDDD